MILEGFQEDLTEKGEFDQSLEVTLSKEADRTGGDVCGRVEKVGGLGRGHEAQWPAFIAIPSSMPSKAHCRSCSHIWKIRETALVFKSFQDIFLE